MKKTSLLFSVLIIVMMMISCGGASDKKKTVNEVTIGKQVWMTENLNVEKFRNGDLIPEAKSNEEWKKAGENKEPAWCYYENNSDNGDRYGKLYNWYAVNDSRGLAPKGWKIPSKDDWDRFIDFAGGDAVASKKMKSTDFWSDNQGESGNGTNELNFSALPGGIRNGDGSFDNIGYGSYWWSATENDANYSYARSMSYNYIYVSSGAFVNELGFSVRCFKDI